MTAERYFQPAPRRHAVDGGDDRLGRPFDRRDDIGQGRHAGRPLLAELLDVGAAAEHAAGPGDDQGVGTGVVEGGLYLFGEAASHGGAKGVDGGVVDGKDGDVAAFFGGDGAHVAILRFAPWHFFLGAVPFTAPPGPRPHYIAVLAAGKDCKHLIDQAVCSPSSSRATASWISFPSPCGGFRRRTPRRRAATTWPPCPSGRR